MVITNRLDPERKLRKEMPIHQTRDTTHRGARPSLEIKGSTSIDPHGRSNEMSYGLSSKVRSTENNDLMRLLSA